MLMAFNRRLSAFRGRVSVVVQNADVTRLPFATGQFDLGVAVHLFYFIKEWRRAARELLRVVRRTGKIVLMHTGMGAEVPELNEAYRRLCAMHGCPIEDVGVSSTGEVADFYKDLGCRVEWIKDRWQWTARINLDRALGYMSSRAYAFTTRVSASQHRAIMAQLEQEARRRFGKGDCELDVPNQVYLVVIHRD